MGRYSVKRIYTILLLMILLGISVAGCQQETAQELTTPIESKTYVNEKYGFSADYPGNWTIDESGEVEAYEVRFSKGNEFISIMIIHSINVYPSFDLDIWYRESVSWLTDTDREDTKILEESNMIIGGLPAKAITFTYETSQSIYKNTTVFVLGEDYPITIMYDTTVARYDNYSDHFNLIVDTFKFSP